MAHPRNPPAGGLLRRVCCPRACLQMEAAQAAQEAQAAMRREPMPGNQLLDYLKCLSPVSLSLFLSVLLLLHNLLLLLKY